MAKPGPKTQSIDGFKGLDNKLQPERTSQEYLKEVVNFDIDGAGGLLKRKGYTPVYSGTNVHSVFSQGSDTYFVDDGTLKYMFPNYTTVNMRTDCHDRIDYVGVNGDIYFTSQSATGVIASRSVRSFGLAIPTSTGILSEGATGRLSPGRYQFVYSYVDDDGRESGTSLSSYIDVVNSKASITVTNINPSSDSSVSAIRLYISTVNGMELYHLTDVAANTTGYVIGDVSQLSNPLENFGIQPAPTGDLITHYNGRVYIADGNIVYASEPFSYDWFRLHKDFMQFDSRVVMLMPVQTGLYVGTETGVFYLNGSDISAFKMDQKEVCSPVMFSNVLIPSGYIRIDNTPAGPKWLFTSDEGIYVCMNQGLMFNVTAEHVLFPKGLEGAAAFVQQNGVNKYVSLIKDQGSNNRMGVGDLVTAELIRNGVLIP